MITWVVTTDALVLDSLNIFLITSVNYSKVEYINQYQEQLSFLSTILNLQLGFKETRKNTLRSCFSLIELISDL